MEISEDQLLSRARAGDLPAFNALVQRYQAPLYNLCLRLLSSPEAAEDTTQEAFLAAYRHLRRFHGSTFRSWLYRIAVNACYDELRRRRRRPASPLDSTPEAREHSSSLEEHAQTLELRSLLQEALSRLPFDQRLAVLLCDVHGLSYEEIAQITRSSLGTVKSRLSRGRHRLRQSLLARRELLPDPFRLLSS